MICPYNRKSETMREVWKQNTDTESETTNTQSGGETVKTIIIKPMECAREECGVFYDGRCHYYGT